MKRPAFTSSRFILCEGNEDAACIRNLIQTRHLTNFDVSPNIDLGSVAGNSGFENALIACEPISGFDAVREVIIVGDNDDDPTASFDQIIVQLRAAKDVGQRDWGIPAAPLLKAAGDPSVTIWMWPSGGTQGCLETVLWQAIKARQQAAHLVLCVETALRCAGADTWSQSKQDKARIRCFLAIHFRRNPALALGNLWRDAPGLIPTTSTALTPIFQVLSAI
jgi:hypothetical protein